MEEAAVNALLDSAARRAERVALMDTCPPGDDELGRTEFVIRYSTWPTHVWETICWQGASGK